MKDFIVSFFWCFAQRCVLAMLKTWPSPIFEKNFFPAENTGNMPEIAVFADFHQTFSLNFVVFSHKNIIDNNGSIVIKTDFWSWNFLKIAGTANFRQKNGISWISRAALYTFSWNFAHWSKMTIPKIWGRPIFERLFIPAENAGNMPENRFFGIFSRFHHFISPDFLQKDAY